MSERAGRARRAARRLSAAGGGAVPDAVGASGEPLMDVAPASGQCACAVRFTNQAASGKKSRKCCSERGVVVEQTPARFGQHGSARKALEAPSDAVQAASDDSISRTKPASRLPPWRGRNGVAAFG